jgi:TonB family protein
VILKRLQFWRNVALIGAAHIVILVGLIRWSAATRKPSGQEMVWLSGDTEGGAAGSRSYGAVPARTSVLPQAAESAPPPTEPTEENRTVLASARSAIELPAATSTPTPAQPPQATPAVKVPPKATPRPPRKPLPKPTPKPTPKPSPKPSPKKTVLAKASPRPTPKSKPTPDEEAGKENKSERPDEETSKADGVANHSTGPDKTDKAAIEDSGGDGGSGGKGSGGKAKASEFASYGKMLHDRFYSEWVQPTTTVSSSAKISTLVRVRIEKDGRVSAFEILKPSGNVLIDESVAAIGNNVREVDPLPHGLGTGGHYDVKINFELNSE